MTKETKKKIKETKTTVTYSVPAYSDDKLVGWTEVTVFKEDEAGLAHAKQTLTAPNVADLNRQKVTDAKNDLRRSGDIEAIMVKVREGKATPVELMKVIRLLSKSDPNGKIMKEINAIMTKFA